MSCFSPFWSPTSSVWPLSDVNSLICCQYRSMERRVVAVIGVGPGLGFSIARRFAREGYTVAILARNYENLERFVEQIVALERSAHVSAIRIDCSDAQSVQDAFEAVNSLGFVEVLVYNISTSFQFPPPQFLDIEPEEFRNSLMVPSLGAFHCVQQVLPGMVDRNKGTLLFTGATASILGAAGFSELACGKFALRALSQCLAREFQPQGIHVAHIILGGDNRCPREEGSHQRVTSLNLDAVAEVYWQIHMQHPSAWTHELDLRPFSESF